MEHYRTIPVVAALAGAMLAGGVVGQAPEPPARTAIDGIWEYINPGMRGQSFFLDGHYVHFATFADSTIPPTGPLSDVLRARIYSSLLLDAGTFSVSDTIVTSRREYSKDPRQAAIVWRWSFSFKGDTCTYHLLNASGQVTGTGRAVRIRTRR